tara:strand:- start:511 stop:804 length:294 start_codon:yes stop_codon:yes gene_type:complete
MKILKNKEVVKKILIKFPETRDCDKKLTARFWSWEKRKKNITGDFLTEFYNGKFANAETIRRSRAKLQENEPELRGKNYMIRKGIEEQETRAEMRNS